MIGFVLGLFGVAGLSMFMDLGNDKSVEEDEGVPEEEESQADEELQLGVLANWDELEDNVGTSASDVIGVQVRSAAGISETWAEGGAGDDIIYVNGGTAIGGDGDDSLTVLYAVTSDIFDEQAYPVALGGVGDDLISIQSSPAIVDAGDGNDTVSFDDVFGNESHVDVTLGDGNDVIEIVCHDAPDRTIAELHDFDPAQDEIEIIRTPSLSGDAPEAISGWEVAIKPVDEEEYSELTISMQLANPEASLETYSLFVHGFDASDADDIKVTISEQLGELGNARTILEPVRVGNDLALNITVDDLQLTEGLSLSTADSNALGDVERVILNISNDTEFSVSTKVVEVFSGTKSGGYGDSSNHLLIIQGPVEFGSGPLFSYTQTGDDSNYLAIDPSEDEFDNLDSIPEVLDPFVLIGSIYLGSIHHDYDHPENENNTVNNVEVVINTLPSRVSDLLCMSDLAHASPTKEHDHNDDFQRTGGRAAERR